MTKEYKFKNRECENYNKIVEIFYFSIKDNQDAKCKYCNIEMLKLISAHGVHRSWKLKDDKL